MVPSIICQDRDTDLSDVLVNYKDDLPTPEVLEQEMARWKAYWMKVAMDERPSTCASTIKVCDKILFPNIYTLLQIVCTVPATSAECERNGSTLRRLHTFNRACMNQERLSSLGLISIYYEKVIDLDKVVDLFAQMHPRRLELELLSLVK